MVFENTAAFLTAFFMWLILCVAVLISRKAKIAAICVISAAALSLLWQVLFFGTDEIPDELFKNSTGIVAEVTQYSGFSKSGKSTEINVKFDCAGKSIRAIVYTEDQLPQLVPGDIIRMDASFSEFENTESFAAEAYYKSRYIDVLAFAENVTIEEKCEGFRIRHLPQYLARVFCEKIDELYSGKGASFLKSLIIGNKDDLSDDFKSDLRRTGLSHTVSVSGMHISFLIGFIVFFTKNRYLKLFCIPAMFLFALMVGAPHSAIRAVIMQTLLLVSSIRKREYDSLTALLVAACIISMINPYSVIDIAFILSFASTLGIIVLSRRVLELLLDKIDVKKHSKLKKQVYNISSTAALSISATLFTLPILSYTYNSVSLISVLANILLIWLVTIVFILGFASVMLGFLFMPIAKGVAFVVNICSGFAMSAVSALSKLPFAEVTTEHPVIIMLVVFLCIVAVYTLAAGRKKLRLRVSIVAVTLAIVSTFIIVEIDTASLEHTGLRFDVLDVGQGQCIVVTAGESCVVIDCGGDEDAASVAISHLSKNGIDNIDALVFTHAHADHINGGKTLVDSVKTRKVYFPYADREASSVLSIREGFDEKNVVLVKDNMIVSAGNIEFQIFTLPQGVDQNENGIVLVIRDGDYECIVTGDVPESGEKYLMKKLPDCESYIVGHHGSKTSSCREMLNKILPELSVISVGENNSYGHPTAETLLRLEKIGSRVVRTDVDGTITFYSRQENENEYKH